MILCPHCSHPNPEGAKTCEACGESMEGFVYRVCPSCGAINAAESAFCHRCLTPLDGSVALDAKPGDDVAVTPYAPPIDLPKPSGRVRPKPTSGSGGTHAGKTPILTTPVQPPATAPRRQPGDLPAPPIPDGGASSVPDPLTLARDPLVGLEQLLPFEEGVLAAQRSPLRPVRTERDRSQEDADLYHRVATEPIRLGAAGRVVVPAATSALPWWGRGALYLLVLLAALVPWFSGNITGPLVQPRASVTALAVDLAAVPEGGAALVAFDYGPGAAGELDPLAMATLQGLASRSVRILALSTDPAGLGQAQRILDAIAGDVSGYEYGADYVVLGFVPGQEAGLRAVGESLLGAFPADYRGVASSAASPLASMPAMRDIASVRDVDRVIVISDDSQAVRRWVEQVQSRTGVQIDALVTAAVEPLLAPYRQSGQLGHVLGAATGAAEYRRAAAVPGDARDDSDGYAALVAVLVAIALFTNVAEVMSWGRRLMAARRSRAASGSTRVPSGQIR
jgi:hypothetical protein